MAKERLEHTNLGQEFNWLVGRPDYMTSKELVSVPAEESDSESFQKKN